MIPLRSCPSGPSLAVSEGDTITIPTSSHLLSRLHSGAMSRAPRLTFAPHSHLLFFPFTLATHGHLSSSPQGLISHSAPLSCSPPPPLFRGSLRPILPAIPSAPKPVTRLTLDPNKKYYVHAATLGLHYAEAMEQEQFNLNCLHVLKGAASDPDTLTYDACRQESELEEWKRAVTNEIASLEKKGTWEEVSIGPAEALSCRAHGYFGANVPQRDT